MYGSLHFDVDHSHGLRPRLAGWAVLRFWEVPAGSSTRGVYPRFQAETLSKRLFARRREVDHSRALHTPRPAERVVAVEQGSAKRAREMMAANTPIQTGAAEWATPAHKRLGVDAELGKDPLSATAELQSVAAGLQQALLLESVEDQHAQHARTMVV